MKAHHVWCGGADAQGRQHSNGDIRRDVGTGAAHERNKHLEQCSVELDVEHEGKSHTRCHGDDIGKAKHRAVGTLAQFGRDEDIEEKVTKDERKETAEQEEKR